MVPIHSQKAQKAGSGKSWPWEKSHVAAIPTPSSKPSAKCPCQDLAEKKWLADRDFTPLIMPSGPVRLPITCFRATLGRVKSEARSCLSAGTQTSYSDLVWDVSLRMFPAVTPMSLNTLSGPRVHADTCLTVHVLDA